MPLWNLLCPKGAYSPADRRQFAERITDLYAEFGLPRFYVNVLFTELEGDSLYIGGVPSDDFVRIWVDQIARRLPEDAHRPWMKRIRATVAPFTSERGLRWELHIDETPHGLWLLDGYFAPPGGSVDEQRWARENRPSSPSSSAA